MNAVDASDGQALAFPARPEGRPGVLQFLRLVRENTLATYPLEAFDEDIIAGRMLWRLPSQIIGQLNSWRRINKKKPRNLQGLGLF